MNVKLPLKPDSRRLMMLVVAATTIIGGITFYGLSQFGQVNPHSSSKLAQTTPTVKKIAALGRLEPEGKVIKLSAPLALDGDRVNRLLVKEGARVKAGQVVAIMDSSDRLKYALSQAQKQANIALAKLDQVKAGAKPGEIQAHQATVKRLEAQLEGDETTQKETLERIKAQWQGDKTAQEATIKKLKAEQNNAIVEFQRYQRLYAEGAISRSLFDSKRLSADTTTQQLYEAKASLNRINTTARKDISVALANLNRINTTGNEQIREASATLNSVAEVREVDVKAAQAEVENASEAVLRAEKDWKQAYIRAPIAGQILKIHALNGEKIGESGILDLAETDQMVAVAEVYQSDIGFVKIGQQATITSQAFSGELRGTVSHIGLQVDRQNVFSNQPGENLDRRIVEVKIRLNPSSRKRVASFTNLQVQASIYH